MNIKREISGTLSWFVVLAILVIFSAGLLQAAQISAASVEKQMSPEQLVQEMVRNEIRSQTGGQVYWRFREIEKKDGVAKTYQVYETPGGTVRMLLAVNGEPLSPSQRQSQLARLQKLLKNPAHARRYAKARHHDGQKERKLLAMLPNAFLFQYDGTQDNLVRVKFVPNPSFQPPTREAQVFHHMAGQILIDPNQKRLAEIDGQLTSEVRFFWGLLGHLDKGGTFEVRQTHLNSGYWQMSDLRVNMHGVALFFETIGVQENQRYEDYHRNPPGMTLHDAILQLEHTAYSADAAISKANRVARK
jgi:hypothetical protein